MLTGIAFAICVFAAVAASRIAKVHRTRNMDKAMRDYVRRAY
jgi:hypothetical protein